MDCLVYHGSSNSNIDSLRAHSSTHKVECIYATDRRVVALLYICDSNGDLDTKLFSVDGNVELVERRKGILEKLYNRDGYLYVLDGSSFSHYDYLWSMEVISFEKEIKPLKKIYIKNILSEILEEAKKGNIKIYRYPDRPLDVPLDNSDLIDKFIRFEDSGLTGAVDHLLRIYPEFSEIVNKKKRTK